MKGDGIIRKCPVCEKEVVGSKEAREHAIENNHYGRIMGIRTGWKKKKCERCGRLHRCSWTYKGIMYCFNCYHHMSAKNKRESTQDFGKLRRKCTFCGKIRKPVVHRINSKNEDEWFCKSCLNTTIQ